MSTLFEVGPADVADTNDDWYTPPWLFKAAGLVFDMDVAAPGRSPTPRPGAAREEMAVSEQTQDEREFQRAMEAANDRPSRCADPDCDGDAGHDGPHFAWAMDD